jgi:[acyl-carrier-protein] S-malonyltransferase
MGRDLFDSSPAARSIFETANTVMGFDLAQICFEGPEEKLRDTSITQPAIMTVSLAALAAALEGGGISARPAFMAGHSLGEYCALVVGQSLSLADGMRLVRERARLMAEAGFQNPGTLAAILGLDEETVESICAEADVDVCNRNLPTQTVIGGPRAGVEKAMALARERGARNVTELNVSGAFHSRLMQPAFAGLQAAVEQTQIDVPCIPVLSNITATPLETVAAIKEELPRQAVSPVRWHQSVATMSAAGISTFVEFGPGRVLTGMVRRLLPEATLVNIARFTDAAELKL